jgi:HlyD family secretion protein
MHRTWAWTALTLLVLAAGSYGLYEWLRPRPLPEQLLYGNGHIEGTEIRVAAEIGGRVIESRLLEGRTVSRGDLLVQVDDTEAKLRKARAEAEIRSLQEERRRVELELGVWQHHRQVAETDLARYRELQQREVTTPQRLEQAENRFKEATGQVAASEAQTRSIAARISASQRELDLVNYQLVKTRIVAPIHGTILVKAIEAGEFVQPGRTVATLIDLSRIELKIYLPERDIGKIKLDAPARVRVDSFPMRVLEARVAQVDQVAQFTPRDIHMPEERVRMVFAVKLALDNREGVLKPGMPADAWILWRPDSGWPEQLFVPR